LTEEFSSWLFDGLPHHVIASRTLYSLSAGCYFEEETGRRTTAKLLTRDEAFLLAVNFAKLPNVPRQILKDIPRPINSASRDD
jgi:hypothetical protein